MVAVEKPTSKVGELEVIEDNPTAMGRVVAMDSEKLSAKGLKVGDVCFFNPEHGANSIIRIKVGEIHISLFEECILGWIPAEQVDARIKFVGNFKKPAVIQEPGVNINGVRHRPVVN